MMFYKKYDDVNHSYVAILSGYVITSVSYDDARLFLAMYLRHYHKSLVH